MVGLREDTHVLVRLGNTQEGKLNESTLAINTYQSQNVSRISFQKQRQFLGREKSHAFKFRVLTHSYRKAELPRDLSLLLLGCLSKQKQVLGLL